MLRLIRCATFIILVLIPSFSFSAGHGPLFGIATPTNFKNRYTLDVGVMNRRGAISTDISARALLSYGLTEDITVSFSAPYLFRGVQLAPGRQSGTMPGSIDFEAYGAWRFHKKSLRVATRIESTVYGGVIIPGPQDAHDFFGDHKETQGYWTGFSSGYLSRVHYLWIGASYTHYSQSDLGDRRPSSFFYSLVYGFRPPLGRKEYPNWDWRIFGELTGETTAVLDHHGFLVSDSDGHSIFFGPSILGLYKNYAIQGGLQLPIYKEVGEYYEDELARFAFNFSILF